MSSIKCGNCKQIHSSVAEVRTCFQSKTTAPAPLESGAIAVAITPTNVKRENMFGGKCAKCGGWVEAQQGWLGQRDPKTNKFSLEHQNCPQTPTAAPTKRAEPEDGIYIVRGDDAVSYSYVDRQDLVPFRQDAIYKVYKMVHGSGRQGVKSLTIEGKQGSFTYLGLAIRHLPSSAVRMSLEEAKKFGAIYGFCIKCGRTLTDENSIAAGIGPICSGKGWV